MNIIFKKKNDIQYDALNIGDVFVYNGFVYMVTNQPEEGDSELKSVNLADGNMEIFGSKVMVNKIEHADLILN